MQIRKINYAKRFHVIKSSYVYRVIDTDRFEEISTVFFVFPVCGRCREEWYLFCFSFLGCNCFFIDFRMILLCIRSNRNYNFNTSIVIFFNRNDFNLLFLLLIILYDLIRVFSSLKLVRITFFLYFYKL